MINEAHSDLIKQLQAGDKTAYKQFIDQYQRLVFHIVNNTCRNTDDIEDLCQDIFIKIYRNIDSFRHECKISTWVGKIAYNTCLNYLKKKKIPLLEDVIPENKSIHDFSSNELQPDRILELKNISAHLDRAMAKLPDQYRTLVNLYHKEEMKYAEIGEIMNLPPGTVKSYLFRARSRLKAELLKSFHQEEFRQ